MNFTITRRTGVMRKLVIAMTLALTTMIAGCTENPSQHRVAVAFLLDTSGTYSKELDKADAIINYLLGSLNEGDSLAIMRIDSASFSEKEIIEQTTFDSRPSMANQQKRAFRQGMDKFMKEMEPAPHTDIKGAMLQAAQYLNETGAGNRYILVFSDLETDLPEGYKRDFVLPLDGTKVVALNVTKLRSDNVNPQEYLDRVERWNQTVTKAGGEWEVMNNLDRLDNLLDER